MQEKENVSANTVSTIDPEEPTLRFRAIQGLTLSFGLDRALIRGSLK